VRAVDVAAGRENGREPARCASVAGRVRESVCALGAGQVATLLQQRAQVECAVLVPALMRALVAGLRRMHLSPRFVQDTEVQGSARVAEGIGFLIRELSARRIASLLEQHAEAELLNGSTGAIDQCVYAPRHLPAFPNILERPLASTTRPLQPV
jgi:hypothetical protein